MEVSPLPLPFKRVLIFIKTPSPDQCTSLDVIWHWGQSRRSHLTSDFYSAHQKFPPRPKNPAEMLTIFAPTRIPTFPNSYHIRSPLPNPTDTNTSPPSPSSSHYVLLPQQTRALLKSTPSMLVLIPPSPLAISSSVSIPPPVSPKPSILPHG